MDEAFQDVLKDRTAGDPMRGDIQWTNLTQQAIADGLAEEGFGVSRNIVKQLLDKHDTGVRVSETVNTRLSWPSLTRSSSRVNILDKGNKWRTCLLWPETVVALQKLIDIHKEDMEPDDHVFLNRFGNPISRFGIMRIIKKYKAAVEKCLSHHHAAPPSLKHPS